MRAQIVKSIAGSVSLVVELAARQLDFTDCCAQAAEAGVNLKSLQGSGRESHRQARH